MAGRGEGAGIRGDCTKGPGVLGASAGGDHTQGISLSSGGGLKLSGGGGVIRP
ncbi:MAG: hypothetical protein V1750_11080 [Acidobacteriota bacterium]